MKGSKPELIVGAFAIFVLVVLTLMTFRVGDFTFGKKEGYRVYAYFKNTAGLDEKTKVKIAGVNAGTIDKIELIDGSAKVTIRFYPHVKIHSDAAAYIKATGLLGDKYIEITTGARPPFLKEGDTIKQIKEVADIDDLVRNLTGVSQGLVEFIDDINTPEFRDSIKKTAANLKSITQDLKVTLADNREQFGVIVDRIESIAIALDETVAANRGPITNTVANIETFSNTLKQDGPALVKNLSAAATELKNLMDKAGPNLESISKKADLAMDSVKSIANKIDKGEGTIGKLVNDDALYETVTKAAKGVDKTISNIDRFRTFITFKGDYLVKESDGKGQFLVTIQPRKERYYIVGMVTDPVGKVKVTETTTNGVTVREEKVEDKMEFIAQFARRFDNTALRIGLTENTFGVGADQFMYEDKFNLSFDAWDFGKDEYKAKRPHLRVGADYFAFKSLFVSAGYDNFLNPNRKTFYVGAGVKFEDEDFKYLFGAVPKIPGQ